MNLPFFLLADLEVKEQPPLLKTVGQSGWSQMTIIFGAIGVVSLLALLVVYCFRKQILGRHRHHHHRSGSTENSGADEGGGRGRRKSRRSHRPLNPTLAQTHGLPPIRDQGTPPPPP